MNKKVKCRESFASGVAWASAAVVKMGEHCVCGDDTHNEMFRVISERIVRDATKAYMFGHINFEDDKTNAN